MCGRFNVTDDPYVQTLMEGLGMPLYPKPRRNIAPGAPGEFVVERDGQRQLVEGIWSLLVKQKPDGSGFRPDPEFKTFNARSDRLTSSPLWRRRYPNKRAIVPASGFHEWVGKQCYQVSQEGQALALGALYEFWDFDSEVVPSFTIITVPPNPRFAHIHDKSLPLMLERRDFDAWLDPDFHQVEAFADLMQSRLRHPLCVTPVASPATLEPVGPVEVIEAD